MCILDLSLVAGCIVAAAVIYDGRTDILSISIAAAMGSTIFIVTTIDPYIFITNNSIVETFKYSGAIITKYGILSAISANIGIFIGRFTIYILDG